MADENVNKAVSLASYMPGFIGAGASLLGSFLSNASADSQAEKQFERQKKFAEIQQEYNKELMDKQAANNMRDWQQQFNVQSRYDISNAYNNASRQVQALKQAGLNPASGISPYTSVTPSPSGGTTSLGASSQGSAGMAQNTPFSFGDPVGFMQLAQNAPLAQAQARAINADAEEQELINAGLREKQNVVSALSPLVVATLDPQGQEVNFQITTPEGLETYKDIKKLGSDFAQWRASEAYGKLMEFVHSSQFKNSKVRNALTKEPYEKVRNLISLTQKYIEEKNLIKAQAETEKERKTLVHNQGETEKERKTLVHNQGETELERKNLVISEKEVNDMVKDLQAHGQAGILSRLFGSDTSLLGRGSALLELILGSVASGLGGVAGAGATIVTKKK